MDEYYYAVHVVSRCQKPVKTLEATGAKIAVCRLHSAESKCFVDYTDEICLFLITTRVEGLPKYQFRVL